MQTVQHPGEIIYVPGNSRYAFYNVDEVNVDVSETFLSVANVEMLSSIDDYEKFYSEVLNKHVNGDDRKRMEAASIQSTKAKTEDEGFRDIQDFRDMLG